MAALDRRLGEAERWAQRMCGRSAEAADAASPAQYAATAQGGAADGEDGDMPDLPDIMVDGDDPAEPLIGDKRDAPTSGDGDGDRDNGTAGQRGRNEDPPARRRSRKG
jgi:hypothetical protein